MFWRLIIKNTLAFNLWTTVAWPHSRMRLWGRPPRSRKTWEQTRVGLLRVCVRSSNVKTGKDADRITMILKKSSQRTHETAEKSSKKRDLKVGWGHLEVRKVERTRTAGQDMVLSYIGFVHSFFSDQHNPYVNLWKLLLPSSTHSFLLGQIRPTSLRRERTPNVKHVSSKCPEQRALITNLKKFNPFFFFLPFTSPVFRRGVEH